MKKKYYILFLVLPFLLTYVNAQVEIKGKIVFSNIDDSLRTINGISKLDSLSEGIRYQDYLYSNYFHQEINIIDSVMEVMTNFEYPNYQTGMILKLKIPLLIDTVNTPSYIKINSYSIVPIKNIQGESISNIDIKSDRNLILIYDGSSFVCIQKEIRSCPSGYKKVNNNYCIQINRSSTSEHFWTAVDKCFIAGNHLCTFEEWYYACLNNSGLNNMPLSYEWVNSSSNHNYYALIIGGSSNCRNTNSGDTTPIPAVLRYRYRCCFHLK